MSLKNYFTGIHHQAKALDFQIRERIGRFNGNRNLPYKPLNINEDAAAILNSAARTVKYILDYRAELDRQGLKKAPLIIMNGENHPIISHHVHHMLVVAETMKHEEIAVAIEKDHKTFSQFVTEATGFIKEFGSSDGIKEVEVDSLAQIGTLSLKADIIINGIKFAPFSSFVFKNMLLKKNIKILFCDVAREANLSGNMDKSDPSTLESLRFFFGDELPESIKGKDPAGIAVRNHHMSKMMVDFTAIHHPRIMFLQCGAGHVHGYEGVDFEDKQGRIFEGKDFGLSYFFKKSDTPYVGIILGDIRTLLKGNEWRQDRILVCDTLPTVNASYSPYTGLPQTETTLFSIRSQVAEATYMNDLLSLTGLDSERLTLQEQKNLQTQYTDDLMSYVFSPENMMPGLN